MALDRVQLASQLGGVLKSSEVAAALHAIAESMAQAAMAAAPSKSGAYRAGIRVVDEIHKERAACRVYATDAKSQIIESRSRVLGRAFDAGRA